MIHQITKALLLAFLAIFITSICESAEKSDTTENLLKHSEDLLNKDWNVFKRNTEIEHSEMDDPEGGKNAFHLTISENGFIGQTIHSAISGHSYIFSVWVKSETGMPQFIKIMAENNPQPGENNPYSVIKTFKVTDQWQNCSLVAVCPASGNRGFRFSFRSGDILVYQPKVEETSNDQAKPNSQP